ncbi:MAG: hypothetical protein CBD16_03625 [Betaproteobacteria bacterium TMED156]|nr:MAG: hypothetical protein CBD16_03625 [Betaproteobacteria bacterium TMED156]
MPELKRTFSGGIMNKDLDERLVPNGQYRDALNVQVSTSEGSDVGALQNILGNKIPYSSALTSTQLGLNAFVVGSIRKDDTECVYWFVASNSKSLILEYNQTTNAVSPILVDTLNILRFNRNNLITGVEILDDFLIWTDNQTEPKMIKIPTWKGYANNSYNHTQVLGSNFIEDQITVIKKGPKKPPQLKMSRSFRTGIIETVLTQKSFSVQDQNTSEYDPMPTGLYTDQNGDGNVDTASGIVSFQTTANFKVGDKLRLTPLDESDDDEAILSVLQTYTSQPTQFKVNVDVVSEDIEEGILDWKVELIQDPPLFETKFPRFAYRYKYIDGEYSVISPFSQIAFLADTFDYVPKKGYNLGMVNNLRKLQICDWAKNVPDFVKEIDILYKDSVNNNIYVVKSIKTTDPEYLVIVNECSFLLNVDADESSAINFSYTDTLGQPATISVAPGTTITVIGTCGTMAMTSTPDDSANVSIDSTPLNVYEGELEITSEIIYKVIPSNQILRPYDNVPRKAKALAVSGNRLMFGNYVENYDMSKEGSEITTLFNVSITQDPNHVVEPKEPGKSIKSMRTYQIGVVYRDKFGRETPVFTDPSGSVSLDKEAAKKYNVITANILSPMPVWADSYKFYIKETSQSYYNLSMDKHYPAEDGNVWIAFPSSERNKITEESFMILKKKHDDDTPVDTDAKYKIIAIENEAPDFLKEKKVSKGLMTRALIGSGDGNIFANQTGYPIEDGSFIEISKDDWRKVYGGGNDGGSASSTFDQAIPVHQLSDLTLRISNGANITKHYEIANIQFLPENSPSVYRVNIEERFDTDDINFMGEYDSDDTSLTLEIFQKTIKRKPEFQGRFFAKIQRDGVLDDAILSRANEEDYKITSIVPIYAMPAGQNGTKGFWRDTNKGSYASGSGSGVGDRAAGWFLCRNKYRYGPRDAGGNLNRGGKYRGFYNNHDTAKNTQGFGAQAGNDYLEIAYHWWGPKDRKAWTGKWESFETKYEKRFRQFVTALQTNFSKFRFTDDPNKEENTYTITGYRRTHTVAFKKRKKGKWASSRIIKWTLGLDKPLVWVPEDNNHVSKATATNIEMLQQYLDDDTLEGFESNNPAIWETEPKEMAELDIFYEASEAYDGSTHGTAQTLDYCNCYSFGNGVESDRIRDDFNAPTIGKGVKASAVLEEPYKEVNKKSDIIFSGIFNSTSGINNLNQFIQAENITKQINPRFGSIQLMSFRRGDLDVFLEDKVVKVFSDKDALFNADGSSNVVASNNVLGQTSPYAGEFGISKNPESYAIYGFRSYFADKNRGVILRLSGNGLEPISRYGLTDFFRDKLASVDNVFGMFDENKKEYIVSFKDNKQVALSDTVSFKEDLNGWNTRKSYIAENGLSLNNVFYTFNGGNLWSHNNEIRNNFYGIQYNSKVKFIFNEAPGTVKSFKTINYEGSQARIFKETGVGAITTFVGGTGYVSDTGVATTYSGSGTGATVDIVVSSGIITAVTINTQGSGYTDGEVLTIVGGNNNATITIRVDGDSEFYNRNAVNGWWVNDMTSDLQEGIITRFKEKEGKWFNNIRGLETTDANLDVKEFSVQGLGFPTQFTEEVDQASIILTVEENND